MPCLSGLFAAAMVGRVLLRVVVGRVEGPLGVVVAVFCEIRVVLAVEVRGLTRRRRGSMHTAER